ncbi:MAG: DegT/DnrJ/EryC1/StrS family aminotransferase [Desulfobulbaceae bacterium]|nr:DegT/DnrJ/EryC1/StrS family aminotransferase [Desulfobulbaceae bacterium]
MQVPLLDLKPQVSALRDEIVQAVTEIVDSTQYILGPRVSEFEDAVAQYCGARHAVGVSSGTDALLISLMGLEIGPGDLVLTTPYTFFATMGSILRVGALPVFADIEPGTMNIDPAALAERLETDSRNGGKIKALIPVHLFGQCADMQQILELAGHYNLPVIEDAAQAIGADCPFRSDDQTVWKRAGSLGITGCFSFFPSKNLGGIGDGGMVTTNDSDFAAKLKSLRNHGAEPKYYHSLVGGNFRLDPIQAVVLNIKLKHLESWHQARRRNASLYHRCFDSAGLSGDVATLPPAVYSDVEKNGGVNYHIYNQFVIRVPNRDRLREYLLQKDIGCEVYYPVSLHQQVCLQPYGYENLSFPVAEQASRETLALPIYPDLQPEQLEHVVESIAEFYRK